MTPQSVKPKKDPPNCNASSPVCKRVCLSRKAKSYCNYLQESVSDNNLEVVMPFESPTSFAYVCRKKQKKSQLPDTEKNSQLEYSQKNEKVPKIQSKITGWLSKGSPKNLKNKRTSNNDDDANFKTKKLVKVSSSPKASLSATKARVQLSNTPSKSTKRKSRKPRNFSKLTFEENLKCIIETDEQDKRIKALEDELLLLEGSERNSIMEIQKSVLPVVLEEANELTAPGIPVFDCDRYLCYLSDIQDILKTEKTALEELNKKRKTVITSANITDLILHRYFVKSDIYFNPSFLDLLFKLMLMNRNELVSQKSYSMLKEMIIKKDKHVQWIPSVQMIVSLLLNLGVVMNETCPIPALFRKERGHLSQLKSSPVKKNVTSLHHQCDNSENHMGVVGCSKLCMMIETIMFVCQTRAKMYKSKELSKLVIIFYWIALDSKIIKHPVIYKIQELGKLLLESIEEEEWEENMKYIAKEVIKKVYEPKNMAYIVKHLPTTERGSTLQALVSLRALHFIMKLKEPSEITQVEPTNVLTILKMKTENTEDLAFIHSFVSLVGACFTKLDHEDSERHKHDIQRIDMYLMRMYSRMKDYCSQAVSVRNLIVQVRYEIRLKAEGKNPYEQEAYLSLLKEQNMEESFSLE